MRPPLWHPPGELSTAEQAIISRIRRAKLFVFLRQHRPTLFGDPFQAELATLSQDQPPGQPPGPPAPLALAPLLQAYTGVSDDEVMEATTMDRRWQVGRDCLDGATPPFSQGTLVAFRQRLIAQEMDRRLVARTLEIAAASGRFGPRQLRAALDRRPLWGAGRVADTSNLWGHALRKAVSVLARQQGRGRPEVAREAGGSLVAGASVQAALALDWDAPNAQQQALPLRLDALQAVAQWLDPQPVEAETASRAVASLAVAQPVCAQALTTAPDGTPTLRPGGAEERRMSVEDAERRHGRKRRSRLGDGDNRQVLRDLDSRRIVAVGVPPANVPEARGTDAIATELAVPQSPLRAWHIDRAYVASTLGQQRGDAVAIVWQAWPGRSGLSCPTTAFQLDWDRYALRGPGGETRPCEPGGVVQFPAATWAPCPLRSRCPARASGRRISMPPDAARLQAWRERQQTPQGRAKLRERVAVEHALAHVGRWQGRRARDRGVRKNVCDLRRCAVVHHVHVLARLTEPQQQAA